MKQLPGFFFPGSVKRKSCVGSGNLAVIFVTLCFVYLVFGFVDHARANIQTLSAGSSAPEKLTTDRYGYTLIKSTITETGWLEANSVSGVPVTVNSVDDGVSAPITLPFQFPFYESTFSTLQVDSNGMLHFFADDSLASNQTIPRTEQPNGYIAPFWDDLYVGPTSNFTGTIYYMAGGVSPNAYAVIEWLNVSPLTDHTAPLTFQAVLYENGDIVFNYKSMTGDLTSTTVGVEDPSGMDGSLYVYNEAGVSSGLALRFVRPPDTNVRIQSLTPFGSGLLVGGAAETQLSFRNIGHNAGDQFALSFKKSAQWDLVVENTNSLLPLKDEDLDGYFETPVIPFGKAITITVRVSGLSNLPPGFAVTIPITATSLTDPSILAASLVRFATPVQFVYSFTDQNDNNRLGYISSVIHKEPTLNASFGRNHSLALSSAGDYFYTWDRQHQTTWGLVSNIELAIFDNLAQVKKYIFTPYDHTTIPADLFQDTHPVITAAPNGNIGVLFLRYHPQTNLSNLFFMLLDQNGKLLTVAPVNLTEQEISRLQYNEPDLAVSGDGKFLATWSEFDDLNSAKNIWLAVLNPSTGAVITKSVVTNSIDKNLFYDSPLLIGLSSAHIGLVYQETRLEGQFESFNTHMVQIPSSGWQAGSAATYNKIILTGLSTSHQAGVQLGKNGPIIFLWTGSTEGQASYVMINQSITSAGSVFNLPQPDFVDVSVLGNVEVGLDPQGRAVLLWMDVTRQRRIYYAVVSPEGAILTPTIVFKDAGPGSHWGTSAAKINVALFAGFFQMYFPVFR